LKQFLTLRFLFEEDNKELNGFYGRSNSQRFCCPKAPYRQSKKPVFADLTYVFRYIYIDVSCDSVLKELFI